MPVYNCEKYIQDAVDSVLNQTFTNFELLIIDDASTDSTVAIIKKYNDSRINLIEKKVNTGYTTSLNTALEISKGIYIARMDGDDICMPTRFEKQLLFLESNHDIIACGSCCKIIGSDTIINVPQNNEEIKLALLKGNCMIHPSMMIRKKYLEQYHIDYDITKEPAEDYDLWVKLVKYGKLHNLQEVLLMYRIHEGQVSNLRNQNQKKSALQSQLKLINYLSFTQNEKELLGLQKVIQRDSSIHFNELLYFSKQTKKNILKSNVNHFFEPKAFTDYIYSKENDILKSYFFYREKYNLSVFLNYLKIRSYISIKFTFKDEFKLFLKSIILYKKH